MKKIVGNMFWKSRFSGLFYFYTLVICKIIPLLLFLSACTLEQKIGQHFIKEDADNYAIMVIPPDFLYKSNLKTQDIKNFKYLNQQERDSALFENSYLLRYIADSIFIDNYISNFTGLLSEYGIRYYDPSDFDAFLNHKGHNYIVSLAQIELEEYRTVITTEEILGEEDYYNEEFPLNTMNVNSWFEVSKLNDTTSSKKQVLYASHYIFDGFESRLSENPFSGEVTFKYSIDSINVQSIYDFAKFLGQKYAAYLYDYFLNSYIFEKYPANKEPEIYLHYDHKRKVTYSAEDDRFLFMD